MTPRATSALRGRFRTASTALIALAALASACSPSQPETEGASADDEAMASRIGQYFERNGRSAPWYGNIESIRVERGVITVQTGLELGGVNRPAGGEICGLIHGSDEADFTPGHAIEDADGVSVPCPPRSEL
jgi:hypothetical protein